MRPFVYGVSSGLGKCWFGLFDGDLSTGKIKLRADVEQRAMLCCFI